MTGLEIALIILGSIFVFISFFLTDKSSKEKGSDKQKQSISELWNAKDEELLRERVDSVLNDTMDTLILDTEDQLNRLSNEKIMSLSEYSEQVIEKINQNHKEVVFLYNMLNEKQSEIKKLIHMMDKKKAAWEDIANRNIVHNGKEAGVRNPVGIADEIPNAGKDVRMVNETRTGVDVKAKEAKQVKTFTSGVDAARKKTNPKTKKTDTQSVKTQEARVKSLDNGLGDNIRKDEVIKLKKEGKSVIEISKLLDMGQGEVKLIIDLYT